MGREPPMLKEGRDRRAGGRQAGGDSAAEAILAVVARIPRGKVTTYGAVASRASLPRRARLVGRVLSRLPDGSTLPWHRVVGAGGRIAFPEGTLARREQLERLRREGIRAERGRVDLSRHGWLSPCDDLDRWLWRVGDET